MGGSLYDDGLGLERRPRGIPGQRLLARSLIGGSRNTWRYTLAGYRAHSAASATNALAWSSLEEIKVATALVKHQRAGGEVGFQKRGGLDRDGGEQPSLGPHCGRGTPARDVRCFESCLVDWGFDGMAGGLEHEAAGNGYTVMGGWLERPGPSAYIHPVHAYYQSTRMSIHQ